MNLLKQKSWAVVIIDENEDSKEIKIINLLKENNYIEIDENGNIELLEKGNKIAENILHRHHLLTNLFIKIGVDEKIAQQDACKIEHDLSKETFAAIEKLVENL